MDRLVHTALGAVAVQRDQRVTQAQNLANMNVPGFRRDLASATQSLFVMNAGGTPARVVPTEAGPPQFSDAPAIATRTGDPFDIALDGPGYFMVQPADGGAPALSRRGDLRLDPARVLTDGAGDRLLSVNSQPITLPLHSRMDIDQLGQISIVPPEGGEPIAVAMLATTLATGVALSKGPDGHIRPSDGAPLPAADQGGLIRQGLIEGSNVDAVGEMVAMIEMQRGFELSMQLITTARDLDEGTSRLMRLPD